jgi:hypothetical protein
VGIGIVHVVEVKPCREGGIGRTGEEVKASVVGQYGVALFDDCGNRSEDKNIVVSGALCKFAKCGHRIGGFPGVEVLEADAFFTGPFHGEEERSAVKAGVVDIGDHQQGRFPVIPVDHVVDGRQSHGPNTGQNGHFSALYDFHLVEIAPGGGVVIGMHGADHAGEGFGQGGRVKTGAVVDQQAILYQYILGNNHIGGITSDVGIAVSRGAEDTNRPFRVVYGRLDGVFLPGRKLVSPVSSHLHDLPAELMAYDDRVIFYIIRDPLMGGTLVRRLVRRHADAVGNDFGEDFIVADGGKGKLLQTELFFAV